MLGSYRKLRLFCNLMFIPSFSWSVVPLFPSSSPGKTFLRAPQMNINIATWGRLVRRAIPTVSTNSFSPQAAEMGHGSLPGSPTPCRYPHAQSQTEDIHRRFFIQKISLPHSDPLVTKLDFDKEPTPGPKHYPLPDNIREPQVQDKIPDKEEVQVRHVGNPCDC